MTTTSAFPATHPLYAFSIWSRNHMKTTKHTAGPWIFRPTTNPKNGSGWRDIIAPSEFGPVYIGEAMENDADLISAAPDLLAALDAAEDHLVALYGEGGPLASGERPFALHNQIVEAISKAKGTL